MMAEKIGFLTSEIGLTSSEAEKFWPIYNEAQNKMQDSFHSVFEAFKALDEAVENNASEEELAALTDAYTAAVHSSDGIDSEYISKYREVLSAEKVAKLILGEEKYRRNQIHRWRDK